MAFPNPAIGDIVATTLENRSKKAADNVTRNNALLMRLKERGTAKPFSGGREIWQELEYALNQTAMWYSGYEVINIAPSQIFTAATFPIRQAAVAVSISGLEELQNAGEEQMIDLIEGRVKNAENTLTSLIAQGVYSDGSQPKEIGGLQLLISDSPATGTVGGIDASTWQFWRNIAFSAVTNGGAAITSANIRRYMDQVWVQLVRGTDRPDLLVADNNAWLAYNESLQPLQRITNAKLAEGGFMNLKYMDADVVLDGGFQGFSSDPIPLGGAPANTMYFTNTKYIQYKPHRSRNFTPLNPDRYSVNQDAVVKLQGWAGNLTISNRRMQGVLFNS